VVTGTLRVQGVVEAQGPAPWQWMVFRNPMLFALFPAVVASSLSSARLSAAEGGLVQVVEHVHVLVLAGVMATLFLGGWALPDGLVSARVAPFVGGALFLLKSFAVLWLGLWVGRALRRDQPSRRHGWTVPLSLVCVAASGGLLIVDVPASLAGTTGPLLAGVAAIVAVYVFARRARSNRRPQAHLHPFL
jgi:NADH:ubiquinone oxidoreductase subunit H